MKKWWRIGILIIGCGLPHLAAAATLTYTYDAVGRLTGFTLPAGNVVTYTYDANGNRTHESITLTNASDPDGDGIPNSIDNCPNAANATQDDGDGDAMGNACETLDTAGTVAGETSGGIGNRDGVASVARFNFINGVTADDAGCTYIADTNNFRIRALCNGVVTTLAGNKTKGFVDGIGAAAKFSAPDDMTLSADGTILYIADAGNHAIRALDLATNTVTTLAGTGTAGATDSAGGPPRFRGPRGLRRCGTTLFVADTDNSTIRAIDLTTNLVTTIAGKAQSSGKADGVGTLARFKAPQQLACVDAATVYVADSLNHTIRRVVKDVATWSVTTVVGTAGSAGAVDGAGTAVRLNTPRGVAVDGTQLYISDSENNAIRVVDLADGFYTTDTIAGGTYGHADGIGVAAQLAQPRGLSIVGNTLYVAETYTSVVRAIDLTSKMVTTFAGQAKIITANAATADNLSTPGGIAIDVDGGAYYVADMNNRVVKKLVTDTDGTLTVEKIYGKLGALGDTDGAAGTAVFYTPIGVAATIGSVYVSDPNRHVIRQINLSNGSVTTIAGGIGASGYKDAVGTSARFNLPYGLEVDGDTLYVADAGNHVVRAVNLVTKAVTTVVGTAGTNGWKDGAAAQALLKGPKELLMIGSALYIADTDNQRIRTWNTTTGQVTTIAGSGVAGWHDDTGTAAQFDTPRGLATDGTQLFVADSGNALIRSINLASGVVTTKAGDGAMGGRDGIGSTAGFVMPRGICFDPDRHALLVVDSFDKNIRWVH